LPADTNPPIVTSLLPDDLALDEPDHAGALSVFPLLGAAGRLEYLSFAEASAHGCTVQELEPASVNDLWVVNPLDVPVLLFEGEEVVGAQQDRTFDVTVLVAAGARVRVAVSCVEAGRWDGARHGEAFAPSEQSAFPALRAAKNRRVREAMAAGLDPRADQQEVWREVGVKAQRLDGVSDTGAMGGIYAAQGERLARLERGFARREGQLGALACIGGRPVVLDYLSRPDVFAALWAPLLRGYCLDALEHQEELAPTDPTAFLDAVRAARPRRAKTAGLGHGLTFTSPALGGAGLAVGGELVQLSAFAADAGASPRAARIRRPSRRR
jgi:hypothetical protein